MTANSTPPWSGAPIRLLHHPTEADTCHVLSMLYRLLSMPTMFHACPWWSGHIITTSCSVVQLSYCSDYLHIKFYIYRLEARFTKICALEGKGASLSLACALSQSGTPREITTCWLRPAPGWQKAGPILRCSPWSGSEQGRLGSWGTAPCHAQSRADQVVAMPPQVTLRVGPIGGLEHRPLSHSRQGRWGGCGATPCHVQSRANPGVGALPPVTHRAGPIRGVGAPYPVTHGAGSIRGLGSSPPSRTEQGPSGGLGHRTLSHTEPQGDQRLGSSPLSGTEQDWSGGWGAFPCHIQSCRAIRGFWRCPLSC
uniref:Uncharacterized protein n=1 Tax=Myotis myotis TaxID=51298 RepID=A0A7J7ZXV6_MYOMY|nr:hypothetical protein mMyoMyo1_009821 [Myotis myotis]